MTSKRRTAPPGTPTGPGYPWSLGWKPVGLGAFNKPLEGFPGGHPGPGWRHAAPEERERATNSAPEGEREGTGGWRPRTPADGACATHGLQCAYTGLEESLCPVCHAPWEKIELAWQRQNGKTNIYVDSKGQRRDDTDYRYPGGYGETREEHTARHAERKAARDAADERARAKKAGTAQQAAETESEGEGE